VHCAGISFPTETRGGIFHGCWHGVISLPSDSFQAAGQVKAVKEATLTNPTAPFMSEALRFEQAAWTQ